MDAIIEKELSYRINGCIFDVHNEVGPGLREECYQSAMKVRLNQAGLPYLAKPQTRHELIYLGQVADVFESDFVVSDRIVLELKTHPEGMPTSAFRQTINYLKFWKFELGLLINFAEADAEIRRVVFHESPSGPLENYDHIRGQMSDAVREKLVVVREALLAVHRQFGLGYSDSTYRNLLTIGFQHRGLTCDVAVTAQPVFREHRLLTSPITPLAIDGQILVQVEAIQDGVTKRALRTMQTHLECMNADVGVIASFGQSRFEIRGVCRRKKEGN
jgi:GxxExxY protein